MFHFVRIGRRRYRRKRALLAGLSPFPSQRSLLAIGPSLSTEQTDCQHKQKGVDPLYSTSQPLRSPRSLLNSCASSLSVKDRCALRAHRYRDQLTEAVRDQYRHPRIASSPPSLGRTAQRARPSLARYPHLPTFLRLSRGHLRRRQWTPLIPALCLRTTTSSRLSLQPCLIMSTQRRNALALAAWTAAATRAPSGPPSLPFSPNCGVRSFLYVIHLSS